MLTAAQCRNAICPPDKKRKRIADAVRYAGKPVSVSSLQSLPVLFPFSLTRPLGYVMSN